MLHIFSGAPVVRGGEIQVELGGAPTSLWKKYNYNSNDLRNNNVTASCTDSSVDICYEYNASQLSCVKDEGATDDMENVPQYDDAKKCLEDRRTITDDFYQEIFAESQSLLFKRESIKDSVFDSCKVYPEGDGYFEGAASLILVPCEKEECKSTIASYDNSCAKDNKPSSFHCNSYSNEPNAKPEVELPVEAIAVTSEVIAVTPGAITLTPDFANMQQRKGCNCLFNMENTEGNHNTCYDVNLKLVKLTPLAFTLDSQHTHNVCVVVLQIFPLKKVLIKQGVNVGNSIELASVMVGDESKFYCIITLWVEAAAWVERLVVGDVILFSNISFKLSKNKIVGRSNKHSTVYNFHTPKLPYSHYWKSIICMKKLHSFVVWIQQNHNYLNSNVMQKTSTLVKLFTQISCENINTVQARILDICVYKSQSDHYSFFYHKLPKVIVEIQDESYMSRNLYLWGEQYKWLEAMKVNINSVIVISDVMQIFDNKTNIYTLHTTSKSSIKYIHSEDDNLKKSLSIISYFNFDWGNEEKIYLSSTNLHGFDSLDGILYQGCSVCFHYAIKDVNGVFTRCSGCKNATISYCFSKFSMGIQNANNNNIDNWKDSNSSETGEEKGLVTFDKFSNCLEIFVYPDNASKLFPKFLLSKNNCCDPGMHALDIFKSEMTYYLSGRVFDFSLRRVATNDEQLSLANEDMFLLEDLQEASNNL